MGGRGLRLAPVSFPGASVVPASDGGSAPGALPGAPPKYLGEDEERSVLSSFGASQVCGIQKLHLALREGNGDALLLESVP